jgi:hypothetical protein
MSGGPRTASDARKEGGSPPGFETRAPNGGGKGQRRQRGWGKEPPGAGGDSDVEAEVLRLLNRAEYEEALSLFEAQVVLHKQVFQ